MVSPSQLIKLKVSLLLCFSLFSQAAADDSVEKRRVCLEMAPKVSSSDTVPPQIFDCTDLDLENNPNVVDVSQFYSIDDILDSKPETDPNAGASDSGSAGSEGISEDSVSELIDTNSELVPLAHYTFDAGTMGEGVIEDQGAKVHNALILGDPVPSAGKFNEALEFLSSFDFIDLSYIGYEQNEFYSISFWVKGNLTEAGWLYSDSNFDLRGKYLIQDETSEKTKEWNHVVAAVNGNTVDIYFNGEKSSETIKTRNFTFFNTATLGNMYNRGVVLDEVMIFDKKLEAAQVQELYGESEEVTTENVVSDEQSDTIMKCFYTGIRPAVEDPDKPSIFDCTEEDINNNPNIAELGDFGKRFKSGGDEQNQEDGTKEEIVWKEQGKATKRCVYTGLRPTVEDPDKPSVFDCTEEDINNNPNIAELGDFRPEFIFDTETESIEGVGGNLEEETVPGETIEESIPDDKEEEQSEEEQLEEEQEEDENEVKELIKETTPSLTSLSPGKHSPKKVVKRVKNVSKSLNPKNHTPDKVVKRVKKVTKKISPKNHTPKKVVKKAKKVVKKVKKIKKKIKKKLKFW